MKIAYVQAIRRGFESPTVHFPSSVKIRWLDPIKFT